jgi:hypothetical protein
MSYYYKKSILFEFSINPTYIKVNIKDNKIDCENSIIKKDIEDKIKKSKIKINIITFYISKYDYNIIKNDYYWNSIKNLPMDELPIYHINNDLKDFVKWYEKYFNNNEIKIYETQQFTKRKYIFDNQEKCKESVKYEKTNVKYDKFVQLFYHAGDWLDVERYGLLYIRILFDNLKIIRNTMNYLFNVMKKGILIGIKSNKLAIFLPFSKFNYENDFYEELYFDEEDKKLLKEYKKTQNRHLLKKLTTNVYNFVKKNHLNKNIMYDRKKWVANDCFFRNEAYEGDKLEALYEDMFNKLCENRKLPDCVFFLNIRDHPVMRKDYKNAYKSIVDRPITEKYKFEEYAPILSLCGSRKYNDIPLVTQDDWYRARKKYFPDDCKNIYIENKDDKNDKNKDIELDWDNKKPIAIFRGSATGCGVTDEDNMRIKATILSKEYPNLLDAGLTAFNRRPKKAFNKPLDIIDPNKLKIKKANFITTSEKSRYKYILTIDGHVSAFRLSYEFSLKSLILLQDSEFFMWYSDLLKPYEHYVPIKKDLSDLITQIEWCKLNDDKCKKISENAYDFYINNLQIDNMYDYMQNVLKNIPKINDNDNDNNKIISKNNENTSNKIAIITIYRDNPSHERLKQKRLFMYYMTKILRNNPNYTIIVVEQNYTDKFNIGKLKNIGFDYLTNTIKKKYDNYIFIDVDMIPDSYLLPYFYKITNGINSLASLGTRYTTTSVFLGACVSCTFDNFIKINGYPNNYSFGWGGEDGELILRSNSENLKIYKNKEGSLLDIEEINNIAKTATEKIKELKETDDYSTRKYETLLLHDLYEKNGLNNLNYKILNEFNHNNLYHLIVDPLDEEFQNNNPKLYDFNKYNDVVKEYSHLKKKFNSIKSENF